MPGHADEFAAYKEWDLAELTQKYLQLMITLAVSGSSTTEPGGMLIHCISGTHSSSNAAYFHFV